MGATSTASAGRQLDDGHIMYCWQACKLHCTAHLAGDQSRLSPNDMSQAWLAHLMNGRAAWHAAVRRESSRRGGRLHRGKGLLSRLRPRPGALLYMEAKGLAGGPRALQCPGWGRAAVRKLWQGVAPCLRHVLGLGRLTGADIDEDLDSKVDVIQEPHDGSPEVKVDPPVEGKPKDAEDVAHGAKHAVKGAEGGGGKLDDAPCSQACHLRQDRHNGHSQVGSGSEGGAGEPRAWTC